MYAPQLSVRYPSGSLSTVFIDLCRRWQGIVAAIEQAALNQQSALEMLSAATMKLGGTSKTPSTPSRRKSSVAIIAQAAKRSDSLVSPMTASKRGSLVIREALSRTGSMSGAASRAGSQGEAPEVSDGFPPAVGNSDLCQLDGPKILLFGGSGESGGTGSIRKGSFEAKSNTIIWERFNIKGASWGRRYKHVLDSIDSKFYLFGGSENDQFKDMLHEMKPIENKETKEVNSGECKVLYYSDGSHYGKYHPLYKIVNKKLVIINRAGSAPAVDDIKYIDLAHLEQSVGLTSRTTLFLPKSTKDIENWVKTTHKALEAKIEAGGDLNKLLKVALCCYPRPSL